MPALLDWFRGHARDLPWRHSRDPYAIWISEIMLQQTQVKTVIPYWTRWMAAFPTVESLARAPEDQVLKHWEGLGYYSRARNLAKAARTVVDDWNGQFPTTLEGLLELPGIGRYTAGAIASIAFNQPAPILDGNVIRVLTRLHALEGDPKGKELNARLWRLAGEWVGVAGQTRQSRAGSRLAAGPCSALNQSLMELGATVCLPRSPKCDLCPIQAACLAHRMNRVEAFPQVGGRPKTEERQYVVVVIERGARYWVRRRPEGIVNAGFWEFPNLELNGMDARDAAAEWLSVPPSSLEALGTIRHSITRYRIRLEVYLARTGRHRPPTDPTGRWANRAELESLHLTAAHRRIVKQALDSVASPRASTGEPTQRS